MELAERPSFESLNQTLEEMLIKLKEPDVLEELTKAKESAKDDFHKIMNEVLPIALESISELLNSLTDAPTTTTVGSFLTFLYQLKDLDKDHELQPKINEICSILLPSEVMKFALSFGSF